MLLKNQKINILIILSNLGMGGIERHLSYIFKLANKRRFNFYIIALKKFGQLVEIAENEGIPIYDMNLDRTYGLNAIFKALNLRKIIVKEDIHIINAYQFKESLFGFYLKLLHWKTIFITGRRDFRTKAKRSSIFVYQIINKVTEKVVSVSNIVKDVTLKLESLNPEKAVTIYNGVDTIEFNISQEKRKLIRNEFNIENGKIIVGTVANIKPTKGYPVLLEAFGILSKQYKNLYLMITGKWLKDSLNLKTEIEEIIIKYNLKDKIIFTGQRSDISAILNAHDIFVLPSYDEGLSNSILEAMACGKPVITTKVGGNCEVIDDMKNGMIVPPGDIDKVTDTIKYLLENPDKKDEMGIAARKKILENFTLEKMINNWSTFYEELYINKF